MVTDEGGEHFAPEKWDGPEAHIWALVSGLPAPKRWGRLLLILQSHFDDSGSHGGPAFVWAGYIASADEWAKFSNEWQQALDMSPKLQYFKMKEAYKCRGQFHGWQESTRDERLCLLYSVIEKFARGAISVEFSYADFEQAKQDFSIIRPKLHPVFVAFPALTATISAIRKRIGGEHKIEIIFDKEEMHETKLLAAWEQHQKHAPEEIKAILGGMPMFRDDKDVLPLQAADLYAWWLRRRWHEALTGETRLEPPWKPRRQMPMFRNQPDAGFFRAVFAEIRDRGDPAEDE